MDSAGCVRRRLVEADDSDLPEVLEPWLALLSSTGRGLRDDPGAFVAAAAAGTHAVTLLR